jgi:biopolymer transport protein ExbD
MADKRQFLDVWIVETNSVYREVPYSVVTDWIQQGRLLEDDRMRPSGTADWQQISSIPAFAAYLPKEEPYRAEDRAEALEPVQVDFVWKASPEEDDQDVDMIPLIDVSLVLLLFFMMTASVATAASLINTPLAAYGTQLLNDPQALWIGIDQGADKRVFYSIALADQNPKDEDSKLSKDQILEHLDRFLQERPADVTIKADRQVPYEDIKEMTLALEQRRWKGKVRKTFAGVSEKENP